MIKKITEILKSDNTASDKLTFIIKTVDKQKEKVDKLKKIGRAIAEICLLIATVIRWII